MSVTRHFRLHGHRVSLTAASRGWAEAVDEILGAYADDRTAESLEAASPPPIVVTLGGADDALTRPAALERRCRFGDLEFWMTPEGAEFWIDVHQRGWVRARPGECTIDARLELDPVTDGWLVAHHAFYPALLELLKDRGLFPLHAGLVARPSSAGSDGLLICGASGSGKTTLTLALAAAGWSLLGDDTCFLRNDGESIEGLAFWEDVHVTDTTIERFPALSFLRSQATRRANWKRHFAIHALPGLRVAERTTPRWLIFPRVANGSETHVEPISGTQAVLRVTPQSVIPLRPDTVARHLAALVQLGRSTQAAQVHMSADLPEVVGVLERFIASTH